MALSMSNELVAETTEDIFNHHNGIDDGIDDVKVKKIAAANEAGIEKKPEDVMKVFNTNSGVFRDDITPPELIKFYEQWAGSGLYDQTLVPAAIAPINDAEEDASSIYCGPFYACEALSKVIPPARRSNVRILDLAAGTGIVGTLLRSKGFTSVDGLDPVQVMLDIARSKNCYQRYICELFPSSSTTLEQDEFDALVTVGGMGAGHLPLASIEQMIRVVKPGGFICIVMRREYFWTVAEYKDKLLALFNQLEADKRWIKLRDDSIPNYFCNKEGALLLFKVLTS